MSTLLIEQQTNMNGSQLQCSRLGAETSRGPQEAHSEYAEHSWNLTHSEDRQGGPENSLRRAL